MNSLNTPKLAPAQQTGISLIELLVTMAISLFLISGVINVYISVHDTSRIEDNSSYIQENARFALKMMANDVMMAGYSGCLSSDTDITNTLRGSEAIEFNFENSIVGWESADTVPNDSVAFSDADLTVAAANTVLANASGNTAYTFEVLPHSDMLRIWGGSGSSSEILSITPGANTVVTTADNVDYLEKAILVLSDCENADIAQASNVNGDQITLSATGPPGNDTSQPLTVTGGDLLALTSSIYYVGVVGTEPALMRIRLTTTDGNYDTANPEILALGVENMQILYGLNTDGDDTNSADIYTSATSMGDANWPDVVSVRITMLVRSPEDNLFETAQSIAYNGAAAADAPDNRLRRVYTKTITLRNRVL